jgi:hypothetical protein
MSAKRYPSLTPYDTEKSLPPDPALQQHHNLAIITALDGTGDTQSRQFSLPDQLWTTLVAMITHENRLQFMLALLASIGADETTWRCLQLWRNDILESKVTPPYLHELYGLPSDLWKLVRRIRAIVGWEAFRPLILQSITSMSNLRRLIILA